MAPHVGPRSVEYLRRKREGRKARGAVRRGERTYDRRVRARAQGVPYTLLGEPPCPPACQMCGAGFDKTIVRLRATLDRKVPALGYVPGNVGWLCLGCNGWKWQRTLQDAQALVGKDPRAALLVAYLAA